MEWNQDELWEKGRDAEYLEVLLLYSHGLVGSVSNLVVACSLAELRGREAMVRVRIVSQDIKPGELMMPGGRYSAVAQRAFFFFFKTNGFSNPSHAGRLAAMVFHADTGRVPGLCAL